MTGVQTCALPIFGLLSGIIFVYISYNYSRKGIFTIYTIVLLLFFTLMGGADRKSVVKGKSVDLGGRRIIKKKNKGGTHGSNLDFN